MPKVSETATKKKTAPRKRTTKGATATKSTHGTKSATKRTTKKTPAKKTPAKPSSRREVIFATLAAAKGAAVSRTELNVACGTRAIGPILRSEIRATGDGFPRITRTRPEGSREYAYTLTAAGKTAVRKGTVSSERPA